MIQAKVRQLQEEERRSRAVALGSQGAWMKWDVPKRKITCPEIWRLEPFVSPSCSAQCMTLSRLLANKPAQVGLREDPLCKLCGERNNGTHTGGMQDYS